MKEILLTEKKMAFLMLLCFYVFLKSHFIFNAALFGKFLVGMRPFIFINQFHILSTYLEIHL